MWAKIQPLLNRKEVVALVAGAAGATLGASGTYFVTKKKLEAKYAAIASQEIAEARTYFTMKIEEEKPDPEQLALDLGYELPPDEQVLTEEEVQELVKQRQDEREEFDSPLPKTKYSNVFRDRRAGVVPIEPTMENRGQKQIYVINTLEFNQNDPDHTQLELAYYAGDDVLTDGSKPIDDPEKYVGDEAIDRFGHGSDDPNVVYVRNHQMEVDFCITRTEEKFIVSVLGLDDPDELKHEDRVRRSRKARGDYE